MGCQAIFAHKRTVRNARFARSIFGAHDRRSAHDMARYRASSLNQSRRLKISGGGEIRCGDYSIGC
jgi:hypothetical protein